MKKLDHKWVGPFTVQKVTSPATIKLHLSTWEKNIHPVVSVSIIHPYIPDEIAECLQPPQPGPIMVDDQEEYEVKEILDSRFRWGKLWYLVKFVGWSHSDNMWLPHVEVHAPVSQSVPPDKERDLRQVRLGPASRPGPQPPGVQLRQRMVHGGIIVEILAKGRKLP